MSYRLEYQWGAFLVPAASLGAADDRFVVAIEGGGRVEMWRGDSRSGLSVAAPFVWRCPSNLAVAPFPHPPRRTGRAQLTHPALFRHIKPSRSSGRVQTA